MAALNSFHSRRASDCAAVHNTTLSWYPWHLWVSACADIVKTNDPNLLVDLCTAKSRTNHKTHTWKLEMRVLWPRGQLS